MQQVSAFASDLACLVSTTCRIWSDGGSSVLRSMSVSNGSRRKSSWMPLRVPIRRDQDLCIVMQVTANSTGGVPRPLRTKMQPPRAELSGVEKTMCRSLSRNVSPGSRGIIKPRMLTWAIHSLLNGQPRSREESRETYGMLLLSYVPPTYPATRSRWQFRHWVMELLCTGRLH